MNRLKEHRIRRGLTQRDLAVGIKTTQQTIARWEAGQSDIPTKALPALAGALGVPVGDLFEAPDRKRLLITTDEQGVPWGTLRVEFPPTIREYPVSHAEYLKVSNSLELSQVEPCGEWIDFVTLNNMWVMLRLAAVASVQCINDDDEAMPSFATPEAYKALTFGGGDGLDQKTKQHVKEMVQSAAPVISKRYAVEEHLGLPTAEEIAKLGFAFFTDGSIVPIDIDDRVATSLVFLLDGHEAPSSRAFVMTDSGDFGRRVFVNLSRIAVIEAPHAHMESLLRDDQDDDDVDATAGG